MSRLALMPLAAACLLLGADRLQAAGRVEFELASDSGNSGLASREWYQVLAGLKVAGLRIRSRQPDDEIGITTSGTTAQPVYKVLGILNSRNELQVPGETFSLRDQSRLAAWIKRLAEQGPPDEKGNPAPFGLSEQELKAVRADLASRVDFSTTGMARGDALAAIRQQVRLPMDVHPLVETVLRRAGPIGEEMKGLSAGTVLSAVLRPAGVVLSPGRGEAGRLHYSVHPATADTQLWPVGFSAEDRRQQLLPTLFKSINVELDDITVAQALEAIGPRLEVPILYDHNALAAEKIDLAASRVKLPPSKLSYSLILRKVLGQARSVAQLRTDEADTPFLWITSFRASLPER